MKRSTLYTLAAVFAVAALFFFMTTARAKVQCRVCMEFHGRTNCATAVGQTEQAARPHAQPVPSARPNRLRVRARKPPPAAPSRAAWTSRLGVGARPLPQSSVSLTEPIVELENVAQRRPAMASHGTVYAVARRRRVTSSLDVVARRL